jgi:hypothetical protein
MKKSAMKLPCSGSASLPSSSVGSFVPEKRAPCSGKDEGQVLHCHILAEMPIVTRVVDLVPKHLLGKTAESVNLRLFLDILASLIPKYPS